MLNTKIYSFFPRTNPNYMHDFGEEILFKSAYSSFDIDM